MISKSVMIQTAQAAGANAAFIANGMLGVAEIDAHGIVIVGYYAEERAALVINQPDNPIGTNPHDADADDTELLGSRALAAGGRALAKRADNHIALVKGSSGWVGVRA